MVTRSWWRVSVSAGALMAVLGLGTVRAFNPRPDPPGQFRFGLMTIGEGQVMRLSISNLGSRGVGDFAPPCRVSLGFVNAEGGELVPAVVKAIPAGGSLSVEWRLEATNGLGAMVRPVAITFCDGGVRPANRRSGPYAPSVEILDGDGSVRLFVPTPAFVRASP